MSLAFISQRKRNTARLSWHSGEFFAATNEALICHDGEE